MDKALFLFDAFTYTRESVETFDRDFCEHLSNVDDSVTKIDLENDSLESLLNDDEIDNTNNWIRLFI